jgi:hypothetical protein
MCFGCFGLPELKMVDRFGGDAILLILRSSATISMIAWTGNPVLGHQGGTTAPFIVDIIGILIGFECKTFAPVELML